MSRASPPAGSSRCGKSSWDEDFALQRPSQPRCGLARRAWKVANRELRRRTRVASIFPNSDFCLRLVCALFAELDDEWLTGKVYLNFNL